MVEPKSWAALLLQRTQLRSDHLASTARILNTQTVQNSSDLFCNCIAPGVGMDMLSLAMM